MRVLFCAHCRQPFGYLEVSTIYKSIAVIQCCYLLCNRSCVLFQHDAMALHIVDKVHYCVCYHGKHGHRFGEARNHVAVSTRIRESLQRHTQTFHAIAHTPLLAERVPQQKKEDHSFRIKIQLNILQDQLFIGLILRSLYLGSWRSLKRFAPTKGRNLHRLLFPRHKLPAARL